MELLRVEGLTKRFNESIALYDVSFSVNAGEIVAIRGMAGSGKSTLLKLIAGILVPTSGVVRVCNDVVIPGDKDNFKKIGLMTRDQEVYRRMTTRQYLTFFQRLHGVSRKRVDEVIHMTGLIDRQDERLRGFSQSFLTRVRIARSILHKPGVLLLDEPTAHLELETMEILRNLIIKLAHDGTAVLIVTPSREEAEALAHRTGKLHKGRIESWEAADENLDQVNVKVEVNPQRKEDEVSLLKRRFQVEKIPARINGKIILFDPTELTYIESRDGLAILHTGNEAFECPLTLGELEERLNPFGFFRSHRSYIVNLQRVREVIPWTRNSYSLVLNDVDKTTIPLSKNKIKDLERILGV